MDLIKKAILSDSVTVSVMNTTELVREAQKSHPDLSMTALAALGRTLTAGVFMSSEFKSESDRLNITIDGDGGLGRIVVAATRLKVRGFVENPGFDLPPVREGKLNVGGAVGKGYLTVIKDLGLKEPYIGKTQLISGEIAEDFAYYYTVSEQKPSGIALGVLVNPEDRGVLSAGGIFVQPLPGCRDEIITMLEDIMTNFTNVSDLIAKKSPSDIIDYYFGAFDVKYLPDEKPVFFCPCGEKADGAVLSLGLKEAESIIEERGCIEVHCEFCNKTYRYYRDDLKRIFG